MTTIYMNEILSTEVISRYAEAENRMIENEIKEAILEGFDGIDFDYDIGMHGRELVDITPWGEDPPKSDNGYQTWRYSWKWFDQYRLKHIIHEGREAELLEMVSEK